MVEVAKSAMDLVSLDQIKALAQSGEFLNSFDPILCGKDFFIFS